MNLYPQPYYLQQYPSQVVYTAGNYWAAQLQDLIPIAVGIAVMVALGAWALSLVKKALKGEEVEFPL